MKPTANEARKAPNPRPLLAAAAAALCLAISATFFPAGGEQEFIFDDQINITDNPYIRVNELEVNQIVRALVQDKNQLRPFSNLSFAVDFYLHGLDPFWMRAENALLHLLNAWLLCLIIYRLIVRQGKADERDAMIAATLSALLWALHPAHAQAVAYIVQRQTVLAVMGMLAATHFYLEGRESTDGRALALYFTAAFSACILGAGSKEIAWTAPLIIALLEVCVLREGKVNLGRKATLSALAALAMAAIAAGGVLVFTGILGSYLDSYQTLGYGPIDRLLTEARVVTGYLVTMLLPFPSRLALDHDVAVSTSLVKPLTTLPAALFLIALFAGSLAVFRRRPLFAFLGLSFFISVSLESTFLPVELAYDHRLYFSSLFVLPPLAAWIALNLRKSRAAVILLAASLVFGIIARSRVELFRRVETVWADSAKKSPGLVRPWSNLCAARVKKSPLQAIADCDRALALAPREVMPLINKGVALMVMGEKEKAGQVFEDAVKRHPQSALARYNQGSWRANEGNLEAAISDYRAALKLDEFHRDSRLQLGILLIKTGKDREAAQELLLLTRLYPDFQPAFAWLGIASARSGDCQTARRAYDAALQTGPRTDEIYMLEELLRSCPR